jgi:hypothetical protein
METPFFQVPRLALPKGFQRKREALMQWFRRMDSQLMHYVAEGALRPTAAQAYYMWKVEQNPHLTETDKNRLANESKLFKDKSQSESKIEIQNSDKPRIIIP